ncbi:hypothetical protein [Pelagibacterium sp.]|uniref:hypothetical protein n=1 Tax=Pelagibacterium sp. TaxID=1967288 RepID=UPI003BAA760B
MTIATRSLVGAMVVLASTSAFGQDMAPQPGAADFGLDAPKQILFVGNSYFYYNDSLHNHTSRMVGEGEGIEDLAFRSITISGGSLDMHPFAHYLTPDAIGYDTPFDAVILQGHSAAANSESRTARFRDAVVAADALIDESGAQTVLYMSHAYAEGHNSYDPEMTANLARVYTEVGAEVDALVIPVGLAFAKAYEARPELELHMEFDHSHPSLAGSYLAAATTYATLYDASPVGLEYDYFGRLDAETAAFLQQIAADTVAEFQGKSGA